jgi:hypoxanthine phosphoribosyltransferase
MNNILGAEMKKKIITQQEFNGIVADICRNILQSGWKTDYIVGINRGGLTPAVMISHYLNIPLHTVSVSLRDQLNCESNLWMAEDAFGYVSTEDRQDIRFELSNIPIDADISSSQQRKNILIVDDINDTGATLNWLINDWQENCFKESVVWNNIWNNNVKFAVIVDNLSSSFLYKVDFAGVEVNKAENNVWIDFPWENWWAK